MAAKKKLRFKRVASSKFSLDPLQRYTIGEAVDFLRVSRSTLNGYISSGLIGSIKESKRRFIPGSEIARLSALPSLVGDRAKQCA